MAERKVFKCHTIFRNMEKTGLSTIDIYGVTISGENTHCGKRFASSTQSAKSRAKSIATSSLELDKIQQSCRTAGNAWSLPEVCFPFVKKI